MKLTKTHHSIQTFEALTTGLQKTRGSYLRAGYKIEGCLIEHEVYFRVYLKEQCDNPRFRNLSINYHIAIFHEGEFIDLLFDWDVWVRKFPQGYAGFFFKPRSFHKTINEILEPAFLEFERFLQKMRNYKYILLATSEAGSYAKLVNDNNEHLSQNMSINIPFITSSNSNTDNTWNKLIKPLWSEDNA